MELIECLVKTGLTRHESLLYLALLKEGELTGYEAAKSTGIPRSNAYLALAGLVEKGAAYRIEGDVVRYTGVQATDFTANIRRELNEALSYIEKNAPLREPSGEQFINISGRTQILNKMKNLIIQAKERIYLSVSPGDLDNLNQELLDARDRSLKIVLITALPFVMDGVTIHYHLKQLGQVRLITDSVNVLTGEFNTQKESTCLYSKNQNLVQLIKDALTNEIKIIEIESKG